VFLLFESLIGRPTAMRGECRSLAYWWRALLQKNFIRWASGCLRLGPTPVRLTSGERSSDLLPKKS